ncbi:MAG: hypothetical protein NUW01_19335 [Gemmatimonadaceae bacterium]|nr:hypothetical protein [Gemmatimonadaceae bacterium]
MKTANQKSVRGPNGGARPGSGRKKKSVKFADLKTITDAELESIVRDEVPVAMRELVRGVLMAENTKNGPRTYSRAPDLGAIIACLDRTFGKPKDRVEHSGPDGGAIPLIINPPHD